MLKWKNSQYNGQIVIVTTTSVDVGISLSRTALDGTLGASAHVGDSVRALGYVNSELMVKNLQKQNTNLKQLFTKENMKLCFEMITYV